MPTFTKPLQPNEFVNSASDVCTIGELFIMQGTHTRTHVYVVESAALILIQGFINWLHLYAGIDQIIGTTILHNREMR